MHSTDVSKKYIVNLPEMTNWQKSDGAGVIFRFGKVRLREGDIAKGVITAESIITI